MYITGGVGSREAGEAFGEAYELPNAQAYGESCAAIGNMMWNWRMLLALGESRFADVMERALYNGINSGMSLSGTLYCYRNPLESSGEKIRNQWYDTTCCPPNLERIFASLPGYMYSTGPKGVYLNLFHTSTLDWQLEDGTGIRIAQQTEYPWKGAVDLTVDPAHAAEFSLFVRIPAWSDGTTVGVKVPAPFSTRQDTPKAGEYFEIHRRWKPGDKLHIEFEMKPRLVRANPLVREDAGRVALERGPLVYCLEQPDQPGFNLFDAALLDDGTGFVSHFQPDLLGGVLVLKRHGTVVDRPFFERTALPAVSRASRAPWESGSAHLHSLLCMGQSRALPHGGLGPLYDSRDRVTAEPAKRRFQIRGLGDQRAWHDRVRACRAQLSHGMRADAAVGHQAHLALGMLPEQAACLSQAVACQRRKAASFHPHLRAQQDHNLDRIEIRQHGAQGRFELHCHSRAASPAERLFDGSAGFALAVLSMHREQIRAGIQELAGEQRGILGHQVHMKGNRGVRADRANEVGEEEKAGNEVTVGRIQMEGIGPGREAAYGRFEVAQVRGPERYVSQEAITWQLGPATHVSA